MKIYISADIEGVCGIADWKETDLDSPQSAYFRAQMTAEVAAACEGALDAGADEILVKDAHDSGRNIDPSKLPRQVTILRAWTRNPYSMVAGLDRDYDGVIFTGYHSAAGTDGNPLAHTMNTQNVWVKINGVYASEFMLNAYTAFFLGVPALMLTGDQALVDGAPAIAPGIAGVAVSRGIGNASLSIHPALAIERIRAVAAEAVRKAAAKEAPGVPDLPASFKVEVRYKEHWKAYRASFYPGARSDGPAAVKFGTRNWEAVLAFLSFVL